MEKRKRLRAAMSCKILPTQEEDTEREREREKRERERERAEGNVIKTTILNQSESFGIKENDNETFVAINPL